MKISELIKELQKIKKVNGDLLVTVSSYEQLEGEDPPGVCTPLLKLARTTDVNGEKISKKPVVILDASVTYS